MPRTQSVVEIDKLEFPDHLNQHTLTEQELAALGTEDKKALAKDWNIISRKLTWLMEEAVFIHNVIARHDGLLDLWKKIIWLGGIIGLIATPIIISMINDRIKK